MSSIRRAGVLAAATLAAVTMVGGAARAEIRIAVAGPMTGQFAPLGAAMAAGARDAAERAGRIAGEALVVETFDDGCDAGRAEAAANQIVGRGVRLVVGHVCTAASIAAARVYAEHGIVMISPASLSPKLTDERAGPTIFRLAPRADAQGPFLGAAVAERFRGRNVAFLSDDSTYGKELGDAALAAFRAAGGQPSMIDTFETGARNYAGLAARIAADATDVIVFGGYHGDAAQLGADLAAIGAAPAVVGGDALMLDDYPAVGSAIAARTLFSAPEDLIGADETDDPYRLRAAAAVEVYAASARAAGSLEGADVAAAVAGRIFDTAIGRLTFDGKGDASRPGYRLYGWRDGRIVPAD